MSESKHNKKRLPDRTRKDQPIQLPDIPRENPFRVPDGYFDRLPADVLSRITRSDAHSPIFPTRVHSLKWAYQLALAASLIAAGLLIAYVVFIHNDTLKKTNGTLELTASELLEYDGYIVELDESVIDLWVSQEGERIDQALLDMAGLDDISEVDVVDYLLTDYSLDELDIEP